MAIPYKVIPQSEVQANPNWEDKYMAKPMAKAVGDLQSHPDVKMDRSARQSAAAAPKAAPMKTGDERGFDQRNANLRREARAQGIPFKKPIF